MEKLLNDLNRDRLLLLRVMLIGAIGGLVYYFVQRAVEAELPPPK